MPVLNLSTNVNLEGVDLDPITSDVTKVLSSVLNRPENLVMVVISGSVPITFGCTKDPAAFAEVLSLGGIDRAVKRHLIATLGKIVESRLSIPSARFFCNVVDINLTRPKL